MEIGDCTIEVKKLNETVWSCTLMGVVIGYVKSTEREAFRAFVGSSPRELTEATVVNIYYSLKGAVRAVVASHIGKRQYTHINSNVSVKEGKLILLTEAENDSVHIQRRRSPKTTDSDGTERPGKLKAKGTKVSRPGRRVRQSSNHAGRSGGKKGGVEARDRKKNGGEGSNRSKDIKT